MDLLQPALVVVVRVDYLLDKVELLQVDGDCAENVNDVGLEAHETVLEDEAELARVAPGHGLVEVGNLDQDVMEFVHASGEPPGRREKVGMVPIESI